MRLIINIPAYNEAKTIGPLIKSLPRSVEGFSDVLIQVIDDGSTDGTVELARSAGADFVYSHGMNRGLGPTFRKAILKALGSGCDVMVNIDADGQFKGEDIPRITRPIIKQEADIIIGSRFSGIAPKNMPFTKKILNKIAAKIVGAFLGVCIDDLTCGFRAYNREAMLKLNLNHQFTYTQETIIDALSKSLKVSWVPIEVTYFKDRKAKMTKSILNFILQSLFIILKALRDTKPLKFFGFPALLLISSSGVIFITFLFFYAQTLKITPYRNWLALASILLLLGIQLLIFAFLADMIKSNRRITEDEMCDQRRHRYRKKN